jgi:hypothetical protein
MMRRKGRKRTEENLLSVKRERARTSNKIQLLWISVSEKRKKKAINRNRNGDIVLLR